MHAQHANVLQYKESKTSLITKIYIYINDILYYFLRMFSFLIQSVVKTYDSLNLLMIFYAFVPDEI